VGLNGTTRDGFGVGYGDTGGASRFYYVAKASRSERNAGLEGMPEQVISVWGGDEDDLSEGKKSTIARANHHPTVKPIALMRWLVRLVTPPGGLVLDPFNGSGSTGIAAVLEGFRYIGIEQAAEYAEIARCRIAHWEGEHLAAIEAAKEAPEQLALNVA
jgi:site-specific DNA-methyltransferase (adenine-specific)